MVVKRVGPLSCAKLMGTLYAVLGLCIGAVISLVALVGGFASAGVGSADEAHTGAIVGAAFGAAAIVIAPIVYGLLGFLSALIGAALYNVFAGVVGGVEVDLQ